MSEAPVAAAAARQILTFRIADEWYALDVARVRRVEAAPEITPVPSAPAALPGLFVSQGQLIPAVDPRAVLGLAASLGDVPSFVVIAWQDDVVGGILVDWVDEVVRLEDEAVETPTARPGVMFAASQVRLPDRLISILDLETLFRAAAGDA